MYTRCVRFISLHANRTKESHRSKRMDRGEGVRGCRVREGEKKLCPTQPQNGGSVCVSCFDTLLYDVVDFNFVGPFQRFFFLYFVFSFCFSTGILKIHSSSVPF